jgi:hypothetical protein
MKAGFPRLTGDHTADLVSFSRPDGTTRFPSQVSSSRQEDNNVRCLRSGLGPSREAISVFPNSNHSEVLGGNRRVIESFSGNSTRVVKQSVVLSTDEISGQLSNTLSSRGKSSHSRARSRNSKETQPLRYNEINRLDLIRQSHIERGFSEDVAEAAAICHRESTAN